VVENKHLPVVLCILDGWGKSESDVGNAIVQGKTPVFDDIDLKFPPTSINASSRFVGLPDGQMGNSEVGHLNIGAGRLVLQTLPMINTAISDGTFFTNPVIDLGMKKALESGKGYHLLGLVSYGGVHSHIDHIEAFIKKAGDMGLEKVFIHSLMDGRDTPPDSGLGYMQSLMERLKKHGVGKVATVGGRYYGMDRDKRWERVESAFRAIVHGESDYIERDPVEAVRKSYGRGETDEFIKPTVIADSSGNPLGKMGDGDIVQLFNFRADRVRQITAALFQKDFDQFDRGEMPLLQVRTITEYDETFHLPVAFDVKQPRNNLGEYLSGLGIKQFRTAETEKYAHVTFFFNGGVETPYPGEVRKLIPSPKVATYDLQPEMSAEKVADEVVKAVRSGEYRLITVNFANGDMVGHTGVWEAALKAVGTVDACVGRVKRAVEEAGGWLIITADHGNIEEMIGKNGEPITSHSTNVVPFYIVGPKALKLRDGGGALCDIAPTVLDLMGLKQPEEMTGVSLIKK